MRDIFTRGMQRWFALKGFQVGIPTEGIDQRLGFEDFQSRVKDFGKLAAALGGGVRLLQRAGRFGGIARTVGRWGGAVGAAGAAISLSDLLIDTGATADDLYDALKPYASRADLIGLKISDARVPSTLKENPRNKTFWNTVLIPVIYADDLTPDSVAQRLDKFLGAAATLKRLGLRAKLIGNRASIYPLLVYLDGEKLEEDKEPLWPHVFEEEGRGSIRPRTRSDKSSWAPGPRAKLSAGVVNVPTAARSKRTSCTLSESRARKRRSCLFVEPKHGEDNTSHHAKLCILWSILSIRLSANGS